ncbi:hypothetical protein HanIR_Chr14g0702471 [Helianthus annuus]|nr:hypothetical protein HanIR_Chr14g0702471 [Helianthus annuus]
MSSSAFFIQLMNPISFAVHARTCSSDSTLIRSAVSVCNSSSSCNRSISFFKWAACSSDNRSFSLALLDSIATSLKADAKSSIAFLLLSSASCAILTSFRNIAISSLRAFVFEDESISPLRSNPFLPPA